MYGVYVICIFSSIASITAIYVRTHYTSSGKMALEFGDMTYCLGWVYCITWRDNMSNTH